MNYKKTIKTQSGLDKIPLNFEGEIVIIGGTVNDPIILNKRYEKAFVILSGNAVVEMWGSSQVNSMWESSQVNSMRESSQVKEMRESSQVNSMRGSSQVNSMWGSSQVKEMRGSSQVNSMRESSQVNSMWESSQVNSMRESSQVKEMWGTSTARLRGKNKVYCFGFNYVFLENGADASGVILNKTSQILCFDSFNTKPDIQFYLANYPIKEKEDGVLIMYKAVHKEASEYVSNYDKSFKYEIGETKTHPVSDNINDSCSPGLHVGDLRFAVEFGKGWTSYAILELEVPKDKIVVSKDCNGKVRTSDLKVIRELETSEYEHLL